MSKLGIAAHDLDLCDAGISWHVGAQDGDPERVDHHRHRSDDLLPIVLAGGPEVGREAAGQCEGVDVLNKNLANLGTWKLKQSFIFW